MDLPPIPPPRRVPTLPLSDKKVTFDPPPFLSPRENSSGLAHFSPRFKIDRKNDASLQGTVDELWHITIGLLADGMQRPRCDFPIPYSQGLLFGLLLFDQPAIQQMIADRNGKFTVLFSTENGVDHRMKEPIYEQESEATQEGSLKKKSSLLMAKESHDYLKKFIEISDKMWIHCPKKKRDFTISAIGFDRDFLKSALFHYYPDYIESIASKQTKIDYGMIHVFLKKGADLEALNAKISKLKDLARKTADSTTYHFESCYRYATPLDLRANSLFSHKSDSGPSRINSSPYFHHLMSEEPLSDCDLSSGSEIEQINSIVAQITLHIMQSLHGTVPKTSKSSSWKKIWESLDRPIPHGITQSKIREIVSLKCKLAKTSFKLPQYTSPAYKELSKTAQMEMITEDDIVRSFYPDSVLHPANKVLVNGIELPFKEADWSREIVLSYFTMLLENLLRGQAIFDGETTSQLLSGLFPNLNLPSVPSQDVLITSMLKSATFGFGGNVWQTLTDFFPREEGYRVSSRNHELTTCEFVINPQGDGTTILTTPYTFFKDKEEKGVFTTKLISSYSKDSDSWSFHIEIPRFDASPFCSLLEQEEIHKTLLRK